jgi:aryl-alcohol dehydrogenase-like predicted oxidoreductase
LRQWLRDKKMGGRVVVATKVGYVTAMGNGLARNHIRRSVEQSLRNLNLECLPLYQLHQSDDKTPAEETMGALTDLQREGLIRAVGFCNMTAYQLVGYLRAAESVGLKNLFSYQVKFNYLERERLTSDSIRLTNEYGLALLVYGVLARGFSVR